MNDQLNTSTFFLEKDYFEWQDKHYTKDEKKRRMGESEWVRKEF